MARPLHHRLHQATGAGHQPGSDGFTMVELLVGAVIMAVVIGGISLLQVSELRSSRRALRAIGGTEFAAQAVNLMREEVAEASNIVITNTIPSGCSTTPSFVLVGPGNSWRIAYGVRARLINEATLWFGPSVLVRCGLPYNSSGTLDTTASVAETVVTDRLPTSNGLVVTSTGGAATLPARHISAARIT